MVMDWLLWQVLVRQIVKTEAFLPQSRGNCLQATRTAFAPIFFAFLYPTITTKRPCAPLPLSPRFTPLNTFWALHILVNTIPIAAVCSFTTTTMIHALEVANFTVNCIAELASGPCWSQTTREKIGQTVWTVGRLAFITLHGHDKI